MRRNRMCKGPEAGVSLECSSRRAECLKQGWWEEVRSGKKAVRKSLRGKR